MLYVSCPQTYSLQLKDLLHAKVTSSLFLIHVSNIECATRIIMDLRMRKQWVILFIFRERDLLFLDGKSVWRLVLKSLDLWDIRLNRSTPITKLGVKIKYIIKKIRFRQIIKSSNQYVLKIHLDHSKSSSFQNYKQERFRLYKIFQIKIKICLLGFWEN